MKRKFLKVALALATLAIALPFGPIYGLADISSEYALGDKIFVNSKLRTSAKPNNLKFAVDEIMVKFKNDNKPFRVIKIEKGQVENKIREYKNRKDVIFAEPNFTASAQVISNDPYVGYQWHFDKINLGNAWRYSQGANAVVAVIDTGIAYENYKVSRKLSYYQAPDLNQTCFVPGYDFVNEDSHPNDDNAHGTHVAGTIAQSTNNNIGTAGIAYSACLMPVKVLDASGSGYYDDIISGIYFAVNNGADVINMSLGGGGYSDAMEDAINYAYNNNVAVVVSAGNDSSATVSYPAAHTNAIAVGATDFNNNRSYYSNYGTALDLVAPGGDTTANLNGDIYPDGILQNTFEVNMPGEFNYFFYQGTSMAAPHVAGVATLLVSHAKNLGQTISSSRILEILETSALDLGQSGRDDVYGYGLINAEAALATLGPAPEPEPEPEILTMSISSLSSTLKIKSILYSSIATVKIVDENANPVSNATVSGQWSGAVSGTVSGLTDLSGVVNFNSSQLRKPASGTQFVFTVGGLTKNGYLWDGVSLNTTVMVP